MSQLAKALWETHQVELDPTDVVHLDEKYMDKIDAGLRCQLCL